MIKLRVALVWAVVAWCHDTEQCSGVPRSQGKGMALHTENSPGLLGKKVHDTPMLFCSVVPEVVLAADVATAGCAG